MRDTSRNEPLPVLNFRDAIVRATMTQGRMILVAPTGSGKSTQAPAFFLEPSLDVPGKILVLQPRRIAARNLAAWVARSLNTILGGVVGYQVRFESRASADTRLLFQTYGVFFQQLQSNPTLRGISLVILDEFHERTLEADGSLAWLKELQATARPDLKLIVMSATLQAESLVDYMAPASLLEIPGRLYPVSIQHQAPIAHEPVWQQAHRAFRSLLAGGLQGTALIFMPGVGEIRRTVETLGPLAREQRWALYELHGSMEVQAQQRVFNVSPDRPENRIIVATNVAETSLTIPGVTAVIDSGLARVARYDPGRDMNTLYLGRISRQNADQRAGRAGRTGPGVCRRLWSAETEKGMSDTLEPESVRLELTPLVLSVRNLLSHSPATTRPSYERPYLLDWLTPPNPAFWDHADQVLRDLSAVAADGRVTDLGKSLLRFPVHPRLADILLAADRRSVAPLVAAMIAVLENKTGPDKGEPTDLFELGRELYERPDARSFDTAVRDAYRQLLRLVPEGAEGRRVAPDAAEWRMLASQCWLIGYKDRIAVRMGNTQSFLLADGRRGTVAGAPKDLQILLALVLHETGGATQNRQTTIPVYLACEAEWVEALFPEDNTSAAVTVWDAERKKVIAEEQRRFKNLVLQRRPMPAEAADPEQAEYLLVEKLLAKEITLSTLDEEVEQLVYRVHLVAREFPEYGIPKMDAEDWRLLYHELCRGKLSLRELEQVSLTGLIKSYVGRPLMEFIDRAAPTMRVLPSGRKGRFTYFPDAPPELSARLGDFIGLQGKTRICEGRVEVVYAILAPNYRVVQKTDDLTGFWKNTYPEVKKELQRRYPKHPWP